MVYIYFFSINRHFLSYPLWYYYTTKKTTRRNKLKLSRCFNKILSTSKIIPNEKENLKCLDLFETLNQLLLMDEKSRFSNYVKSNDMCWYGFSENQIKQVSESDTFAYKIGAKFYFPQKPSVSEVDWIGLEKLKFTNKKQR